MARMHLPDGRMHGMESAFEKSSGLDARCNGDHIVHAVLQACESFDVSTVQQNALPTLRCHRLARQAALEMSSPHHTVI